MRIEILNQKFPVILDDAGNPVDFASGIRGIRESFGESQPKFAERLGVSAKAIQSWEQGWRKPSNTALRLLKTMIS
jgi:DNA-binding transcriptional regulator YiaG